VTPDGDMYVYGGCLYFGGHLDQMNVFNVRTLKWKEVQATRVPIPQGNSYQ
jgi:hypothetical protein